MSKRKKKQNKTKTIEKNFWCDVYKKGIKIVICKPSSLIELLKKYKFDFDEDSINQLTTEAQGLTCVQSGESIIWLPSMPDALEREAVLIHELYHATTSMLLSTNMKHDDATDEAFAYLYEFFYYHVFSWLRNSKQERK